MLARRVLLLGRLGGNVVALRVNMKMASTGSARNPNVSCTIAAFELEPLPNNTDEYHGYQSQHQDNRCQEIDLSR